MNITKGKVKTALKVVVYGQEGVGKSTFASNFPDPVFIDTEGSTKQLDVARFDPPSSWEMLLSQVDYVRQNPDICRTLVVDTADWAEKLCIRKVCDKARKDGIEDFGWGKGYTYVQEEFGKLLNSLEEVIQAGVNVVVTAHAQMRKVEQPDEMGSYDRWELKLTKQCSPMLKEWADLLLFANYKTIVVNTEGKKYKGQGGQQRIMYTTHTAAWDAKNRFSLPDVLPFDYAQIEQMIIANSSELKAKSFVGSKPEPCHSEERSTSCHSEEQSTSCHSEEQSTSCHSEERSTSCHSEEQSDEESSPKVSEKRSFAGAQYDSGKSAQDYSRKRAQNEIKKPDPLDTFIDEVKEKGVPVEVKTGNDIPDYIPDYVPKALADLMREKGMTVSEIENIVAKRGYFPPGTPFKNYPQDFVEGCLIAAFPQLYDFAMQNGLIDLPF